MGAKQLMPWCIKCGLMRVKWHYNIVQADGSRKEIYKCTYCGDEMYRITPAKKMRSDEEMQIAFPTKTGDV